MNNNIKRMCLKEFREIGLLQEVNRKFFHPLGFALEVIIDEEDENKILFGGIQDYRDDNEGIFFNKEDIDFDKIKNIENLRLSKLFYRINSNNFMCDNKGIQQYE